MVSSLNSLFKFSVAYEEDLYKNVDNSPFDSLEIPTLTDFSQLVFHELPPLIERARSCEHKIHTMGQAFIPIPASESRPPLQVKRRLSPFQEVARSISPLHSIRAVNILTQSTEKQMKAKRNLWQAITDARAEIENLRLYVEIADDPDYALSEILSHLQSSFSMLQRKMNLIFTFNQETKPKINKAFCAIEENIQEIFKQLGTIFDLFKTQSDEEILSSLNNNLSVLLEVLEDTLKQPLRKFGSVEKMSSDN